MLSAVTRTFPSSCNIFSGQRFGRTCVVPLLLAICIGFSPASSKDLNVLIRILYAAFLVEQTSNVCLTWGSPLSDEDKAIFNNTRIHAQWIKQKVEAGLSAADIEVVLRSAADRATRS